jgi:hypothetical protein
MSTQLKFLFTDLLASFFLALPMLFISLKAYIITGVVMAFLFPIIFFILLQNLFKYG